jgi:hypothetical protein
MTTSELDTYLQAVRQQQWSTRAFIVAALLFAISGGLYLADILVSVTGTIAVGSFIGALLGTSDAASVVGAGISRGDLLKLIESQINRDPEAVKYVASRRERLE